MKSMKRPFFFLLVLALALSISASALTGPDITAGAALVMDPDSGEVLFEKNADERLYPASTTKIMTAMLALEYQNQDEIVTVPNEAIANLYLQGSGHNLKVGEEIPMKELIRYMFVASGNDAANAIAIHVGGSIEGFAQMMNERASKLGCTGTHFVNPNGLHDEGHYTTARDLYKIAKAAMENPAFKELAAMTKYVLAPTNLTSEERTFYTTNGLISSNRYGNVYLYGKAIGIKTGFTTPAGNCLVSAAEDGDRTFYSVVLNAPKIEETNTVMSFVETKQLLEWAFDNYSTEVILSEADPVKELPVTLAKDRDYVALVPQYSISRLIPSDLSPEDFTRIIQTEESVQAPVEKGQELGTITLTYNGRDYGTVPLIASEAVEQSGMLYFLHQVGEFFNGRLFKIILVVVSTLIVLFIVYTIFANRMRVRRRRNYRRKRK